MKRKIYTLIIISILCLSILLFTGCDIANDLNKDETSQEDGYLKNKTIIVLEKTDVTSKYSESLNTVAEPVATIQLDSSDCSYEEIAHKFINEYRTSENAYYITQIDNNVYFSYDYSKDYEGVVVDWGSGLIEYNIETLEAKLLLYNNKDNIWDYLLFDEKHIIICTHNDFSIYNLETHEFKEKINMLYGYYHNKIDDDIYINGLNVFRTESTNLDSKKFYSFEYINNKLTIYEFEAPIANQFSRFLYYDGYFYTVNILVGSTNSFNYGAVFAVNITSNDNTDISSRYEEFVKEFKKNN